MAMLSTVIIFQGHRNSDLLANTASIFRNMVIKSKYLQCNYVFFATKYFFLHTSLISKTAGSTHSHYFSSFKICRKIPGMNRSTYYKALPEASITKNLFKYWSKSFVKFQMVQRITVP